MGIVYEAYDRERQSVVALKTLRKLEAGSLYRFKKEFRALADIAHPNLISLHELVSVGEEWFFTMELIRGCNFLQHVRPSGRLRDDDTLHDSVTVDPYPTAEATLPMDEGSDIAASLNLTPASSLTPQLSTSTIGLDEVGSSGLSRTDQSSGGQGATRGRAHHELDIVRLRDSLLQLAHGILALHGAGQLHRDIKPSNILVTRRGRVVLCDFGLVAELAPEGPQSTWMEQVVGTVAYMSPEQAAKDNLSEASDWYSVGVVLYEALTARVPFGSHGRDALRLKQVLEPPPPSEFETGIPADLGQLCVDLLRLDPDARPSGDDILARLSGADSPPTATAVMSQPPVPLIGRDRELAAMRAAYAELCSGNAVAVRVHGTSGIGKTALIRHFLDELFARGDAVVLTGRCYERESIPYNAVDSLMDRLSSYLVRLSERKAEAVIPRDIIALARLFPVLRRVEAIAAPRQRGFDVADPQESRRRAFHALRELLDRIARQHLLVLFIDDLQWADADSAALLAEVMRPPDPPPLMLITSHRTEDAATDPFLRPPQRRPPTRNDMTESREIQLEALSVADARELALTMFGAEDDPACAHADSVAMESGGNPLLIIALARHTLAGSGALGGGVATMAEVLRARIKNLPATARSVLEAVAVAGRPVTRAVVESAVGFETDAQKTLAVLHAEHLLRTRRLKEQNAVETYHDRIRQAVIDQMSPEKLRDYHLRLARALHTVGQADSEELVEHWLAGGERETAGANALVAGDQAVRALAFHRGARQYQLAVDLLELPRADQRQLQRKLGDALANAGHGADAANAYRAAAAGATPGDALDLHRRAALQLLRSGRVDEGIATMLEVLAGVGLRMPATPGRAIAQLLWYRSRLKLRGLRFRRRDASLLSQHELARIDVCWSTAIGLAMVDPIRSAGFQSRHLLLSLRAGEPYRVARALAVEVPFAALAGDRGQHRAARITQLATTLADELDQPELHAWVTAGTALLDYQTGNFGAARDAAAQAARMLRDKCTGVSWEVTSVELYLLWSLYYLGEIEQLTGLAQTLLEDAWQRGDHYAACSLRLGLTNVQWLAVDDLGEARFQVGEAVAEWSHQGFYLQHYWELLARTQCDLYEGDGAAAHQRVTRAWSSLERSQLLRIELIRIEALHLRARAALAAVTGASDPRPLLRLAARDAQHIRRSRSKWARPLAATIQAQVAAHKGRFEPAVVLFEGAHQQFLAGDMLLHAAATRRCHGELIGGDEGTQMIEKTDALMNLQGIRRPARLSAMLIG